jgi:hypothetical protein
LVPANQRPRIQLVGLVLWRPSKSLAECGAGGGGGLSLATATGAAVAGMKAVQTPGKCAVEGLLRSTQEVRRAWLIGPVAPPARLGTPESHHGHMLTGRTPDRIFLFFFFFFFFFFFLVSLLYVELYGEHR